VQRRRRAGVVGEVGSDWLSDSMEVGDTDFL